MSQGGGSAVLVVAPVLFLVALHHCSVVHAATYNVGDATGWTFGVVNWPNGKNFKAGDILVFKYDQGEHNVVLVDKAGYDSCTPAPGAKVLDSGDDKVTLAAGPNYFLCSFPQHCQPGGMKIAVTAS
ncbi:hypothetical protein NMG60_11021536 [Bertholletia excelsa]